jgi:hypothetical protein
MSEIVFKDPPAKRPRHGSKPSIGPRLAPLRERPGEWGRVFPVPSLSAARTQATRIKHGLYSGIEPAEYEARGAIDDDGEAYVWVRWLGPQEDK